MSNWISLLILVVLVGFGKLAYGVWTEPETDLNPKVTRNELIGSWVDQESHTLVFSESDSWTDDFPSSRRPWKMERTSILVVGNTKRYRVIRVGEKLEIIHADNPGDLTLYPSYTRVKDGFEESISNPGN